jgi:DNA-directed RNA polymerase subunit RPC12/RpoP
VQQGTEWPAISHPLHFSSQHDRQLAASLPPLPPTHESPRFPIQRAQAQPQSSGRHGAVSVVPPQPTATVTQLPVNAEQLNPRGGVRSNSMQPAVRCRACFTRVSPPPPMNVTTTYECGLGDAARNNRTASVQQGTEWPAISHPLHLSSLRLAGASATRSCATLLFLLRRIAVEPQPCAAEQAHMSKGAEALCTACSQRRLFNDDQPDDARRLLPTLLLRNVIVPIPWEPAHGRVAHSRPSPQSVGHQKRRRATRNSALEAEAS